MKRRIEYFGSNPVRYINDGGLGYICVEDLRDACDLSLLEDPGNNTIN